MKIEKLERVFLFNGSKLPDVNPEFSVEQVRDMYVNTFFILFFFFLAYLSFFIWSFFCLSVVPHKVPTKSKRLIEGAEVLDLDRFLLAIHDTPDFNVLALMLS